MLRDGVSWLADQIGAGESTVTYSRGDDSADVHYLTGQSILKQDEGLHGVRIQRTDRDFQIPVSELILNGSAIVPQAGDRITQVTGDITQVFEAAHFGKDPVYTIDGQRQIYSIRTKLIGQA